MHRPLRHFAFLTLALLSAAAVANDQPCAQNFKVEGSAMSPSGKSFQTFALVPGVTRQLAMERASKHIALEGLTLTLVDREMGLLTASNKVIGGKGDTSPFVISFEDAGTGQNVKMKFKTGFGQVASEDMLRTKFCSTFAAIEGK
jgi:hypothetical protein